jgi:D-arabinose 1-dehydrogenase-like Zn-dependent alcohol dehydrogenase
MTPGHEIIGHVAAVADGETAWKVGDRVGGAWHGGHDGQYSIRPFPWVEEEWCN